MMPSGASYEETILEHVKKAGVQNGYRNERLEFESVEPVSGRILTAVGIRKNAFGDSLSWARHTRITCCLSLIASQFDRDHQSNAPDFSDARMVGERLQPLAKYSAGSLRVLR